MWLVGIWEREKPCICSRQKADAGRGKQEGLHAWLLRYVFLLWIPQSCDRTQSRWLLCAQQWKSPNPTVSDPRVAIPMVPTWKSYLAVPLVTHKHNKYINWLLRHMLAFETEYERRQARRGHASTLLDYSRKCPSPEPPSTMVPLALYKMLLLLNQIVHETPIINSSTRLSSDLEIKWWTMFKALYTPSPSLTWFASLCSITNPNFCNSWVKV